jgi:hypothetical protein
MAMTRKSPWTPNQSTKGIPTRIYYFESIYLKLICKKFKPPPKTALYTRTSYSSCGCLVLVGSVLRASSVLVFKSVAEHEQVVFLPRNNSPKLPPPSRFSTRYLPLTKTFLIFVASRNAETASALILVGRSVREKPPATNPPNPNPNPNPFPDSGKHFSLSFQLSFALLHQHLQWK